MAHPQQGDTRVGDDGVHWVFDGGIWRGDHDMYTPCPAMIDNNGRWFQYFPAALSLTRQYQWRRYDGTWFDADETSSDEDDST